MNNLQYIDWVHLINEFLETNDINSLALDIHQDVEEFFPHTPLRRQGAFDGSPKDLKEGGAAVWVYWNEDRYGRYEGKVPFVMIKSFKHGGETTDFNGFKYLKEENKNRPYISPKENKRRTTEAEERLATKKEREELKEKMQQTLDNSDHSIIQQFIKLTQDVTKHDYFNIKNIPLQQAIELGVRFVDHLEYKVIETDEFGNPSPKQVKFVQNLALIPMYINGEICNIQKIYEDGRKRFTQGHNVVGSYFIIGEITEETETIGFSESFFTGLKIHNLIDIPIICCFNAGNIKSVVPQFVEKYPNKELIIYCDNDYKNDIQDDVDVISTYAGRAYHDHLISYSKDENGYIFQNLEKSKNAGLRQGIACALEFGIKYCVPFFDNAGVVYNPHAKMPNDFEDLLNITGKEETLRQLKENVFPKPYGSEDKLSATDGIAMLDEAIESWYESDGSLILKITTGTGKTTTVVNKIIKIYEKNPNIRIRMFLPTKRLARDIHNELVEKCPSIKSVVIYGRGHEYAPNKTMCAKDHVVSISSSKGQPVYFQFCSHPTDGQCEHFNDCQYIKQYTDTGNMNVVLQTHATLPNSSIGYLESKLPSPDAVIIDEKCHDYFHGHFELTEDQFLMPLNQNNEVVSDSLKTGISSFDENRYKILECLQDRENSMYRLHNEVGLDTLKQILDDLPTFKNPKINPKMDVVTQEKILNEHGASTGKWWHVKKIIKLMIEEMSVEGELEQVEGELEQVEGEFNLTVESPNLTFVGYDETGNPVYDLTGHKTGSEIQAEKKEKKQVKNDLYKVRMKNNGTENYISANWQKSSDRLKPQGNIAAKEILSWLQKNGFRNLEQDDVDLDINVKSGLARLCQIGVLAKDGTLYELVKPLDLDTQYDEAVSMLEKPIKTLVIDANADKRIWDAILPENNFDFKEIKVRQNINVTQLTASSGSKKTLELSNNIPQLLKEYAIPFLENGEEILVIGYQTFVGNKQRGIPAHPILQELIDDYGELVKTAYHGNVRGYNTWSHINVEFIIGRNLPPSNAVEDIACAFWDSQSDVILNLSGQYSKKTVEIRLENGAAYPVENLSHDDEFVDIFRSKICEDEGEQEIGRIRGVHSKTEKKVFLFSNQVIPDIHPRRIISNSQPKNKNIRESRIEQICDMYFSNEKSSSSSGFVNCMPLSPKLLFESSNGLFKSVDAAQGWLKRMGLQGIGRSFINKLLQHHSFVNKLDKFGNVEWCVMEYQPQGQRRSSYMLYLYRPGGSPKLNTANMIAWQCEQKLGCKITINQVDLIENNVSVDADMQTYIMQMVENQLENDVDVECRGDCIHARYDCNEEKCEECPNYYVQDKRFYVEMINNAPVLKEAFQFRLE